MSLPALHEAYETLAAVPAIPFIHEPPSAANYRASQRRTVERAEAALLKWRIRSSLEAKSFRKSVLDFLARGGEAEAVVLSLEALRSHIQADIDSWELKSRQFEFEAATLARALSGKDRDLGKFCRRQNSKMLRVLQETNTIRQIFSDAVTMLLADIDPDAKGGPSFDNPEELEDYLRLSLY